MSLDKYHISERFFSKEELKAFREKFGYNIKDLYYSSSEEIDFAQEDEKDFLLENGYPKISARFFA
ncbi:hypothetical protein [Chryseobacterium koreense]